MAFIIPPAVELGIIIAGAVIGGGVVGVVTYKIISDAIE
jgi:hypothetical protein